jgi:hypothetical protein
MIIGFVLFAVGAVLGNQLTSNKRVDDDETNKSTGSNDYITYYKRNEIE